MNNGSPSKGGKYWMSWVIYYSLFSWIKDVTFIKYVNKKCKYVLHQDVNSVKLNFKKQSEGIRRFLKEQMHSIPS